MRVLSEWGLGGALALTDVADLFVIADVLSFGTCVDIACANGARVHPFPIGDRQAAHAEAGRLGAVLAGRRSDPDAGYTLSASTLRTIPAGTRLLLSSANGSRIAFSMQGRPLLAGCLRNASAVAEETRNMAQGGTVAVIPAGERWPDGGLRPAIEDLIGAGAIIAALGGDVSAEARVAREAFLSAKPRLSETLYGSVSGIGLVGKGFPQDVEIAAELDMSACAPVLVEGAFVAAG